MGTLTVGEVARESGVSGSAVRFYERQGLVRAARTGGNQRRFDSDAACRIRVARVAQRVGLIRLRLEGRCKDGAMFSACNAAVRSWKKREERVGSVELTYDVPGGRSQRRDQ